ncbi:unnamed protein product [Trifolium pratense]|uniref:Uncharacterized protein n=1 Tax=Trifolium pratense TaxID=57577 RepID=A0ACB0M7W4_TRIPR|nr:unnamed protein product [Trifolium pratense]
MVGVRGQPTYGGSKSWEEDIYWTHFQFIHFTQFLRNDFHQQLALPKAFSNNVKKKLPENVTLRGPSGVVWNVGLTTRDDTLYFTNSWQQFVKNHSLKENDFLVFKYKGESHFEVLIFDGESLCEKTASYFVGKCGHAQTEQGGSKAKDTNTCAEEVINTASNGGVETLSVVLFGTTNGKTGNAGVEPVSPEKLTADALTKTTPIQVPFQPTGKRTEKPVNEVMPVQTKKRGRPPKAGNSFERAHDLVACNKQHSAAILNRSGNEDEEEKIAQSFTSSFPYLVKIIGTCNVISSRTLRIPYQFGAEHFPARRTEVTLRNSRGECWTVNSIPDGKGRGAHTFCGGWMAFVRDNDLKVGDACIFELVSNYVMQVYISGVGKEGFDHQNGHAKLNSV